MSRLYPGGLLILILGVMSWKTYAQEIQVINGTTGDPVENVALYNQDQSRSIITDAEGFAHLNNFHQGDTVYFQHTSFLPVSFTYAELSNMRVVTLTRKVVIMPEFVITASKYRETQRDIPHMVDVITTEKLATLPSQNSADLLSSTGNIFVQKSQGGGGSPVLRGFEANKILLVVDGVRMNNAIYRSGHLQNSLTIDDAILEKTEIVYGPNAIMYGSDALGGVIHYITRDPELAKDSSMHVNAGAYAQVASANASYRTHLDFLIANKKLGWLSSFTYGDFGDIRMGTRRDPFLDDYGKDFFYVSQINGNDSILENPDPYVQRQTGYKQFDLVQKFRYRPSSRVEMTGNFQYSTSSEIPRYDQLGVLNDEGDPKYAVWSYGPQDRFLGSVKVVHSGNNKLYSNFTTTAAYQHIVESRITRRYQRDTRNVQKETVDVVSLNLDFMKVLRRNGHIIYGAEINTNFVGSEAYDELEGVRTPAPTRYPDDGSRTGSYAAYASLKKNLSGNLMATLGARYNYSRLRSSYSEGISYIPFRELDIENSAFTGSAGIIAQPSERSKISLLLSSGYRIPNLDDLAKIRVKGNQITFPNPYVKPEYTYNIELGASKTFDGYIQLNGSYFVTWLNNVIVRVPYFENGSDSMFFEDEYLKTFVNDNSTEGIIHGFNLNMISDLNSNISFRSTLNYTYGRDLSQNVPLAHIPPLFGRTDLAYETSKFLHEIFMEYSGWKRMEDMSDTGEDNEDQATEYGFPGWYTLNLRSTYKVSRSVAFQLAIENITNNFYRPFATAVAASGFNLIATLRVKV